MLFITHHIIEHCLDLVHIRYHLVIFRISFLRIILHIGKLKIYFVIQSLYDDNLAFQLVIHLVLYTWYLKA